jgi:uncharacterized membrane protein
MHQQQNGEQCALIHLCIFAKAARAPHAVHYSRSAINFNLPVIPFISGISLKDRYNKFLAFIPLYPNFSF